LSSLSAIGVNGEAAAGERDGAEAVPDWPATVRHDAGVLGAETVGRRRVEAHVTGMAASFCDNLEKKRLRNSERLVVRQ
jgi:hypothetical protein